MRRRDLLSLILLSTAPPLAAMAAEKKDTGKAKKKSGGENYLPVVAITGTTNKGGGRRGVMSVDCGLEINDPKLREFADASMPRLRAAYVQAIQTYAAGLAPGAEPDIDFINQTLQRQTDLVLKRPGARFLIGAVVVN